MQARASSRDALQELRATVALLREAVPGDVPAPAPRLAQLPDLVDRAGGAGVQVSLHHDTGGRDLPAVVELAAYRIVQDALTNVIRHAHRRRRDGDLPRRHRCGGSARRRQRHPICLTRWARAATG